MYEAKIRMLESIAGIKLTFSKSDAVLLKFFQTSRKILYWSALIAFLVALLSFRIWHQVLTIYDTPVELELTTAGIQNVRAFWDEPASHPTAYEQLSLHSWQVRLQATGSKNPASQGTTLAILEVATPEHKADWSQAEFNVNEWDVYTPGATFTLKPSGKIATSPGKAGQALSLPVRGGDLIVTLLKQPTGGILKIQANGQERTVDMYAPANTLENVVFHEASPASYTAQTFRFLIPKTAWGKLRFVPEEAGKLEITNARVNGQIVNLNGTNELTLPFSLLNRFSSAILMSVLTLICFLMLLVSLVHLWQGRFSARFGVVSYILGLSFGLGFGWTLVFYPGLMSGDSALQLGEAISGRITDWHPAGMTLLLRGLVLMTPGLNLSQQVSIFSFFQGSFFWLAIFYAINTFINLPRLKALLLSTAFLYYPLWTHALTMWKDITLTTVLVFFIAELYRLVFVEKKKSGIFRRQYFSVPVLFFMASVLRHNAILAAGAVCLTALILLLLTRVGKARFLKTGGILLVLVGISLGGIQLFNQNVYVARYGNWLNFYMSYELTGIMYFSGQPVESFSYLETYKLYKGERVADAVNRYICGGDMNYLVIEADSSYGMGLLAQDTVVKDLPGLALKYPIALLNHKICILNALLKGSPAFRTQLSIYPNYSYLPNHQEVFSNSRLPEVYSTVSKFLTEASNPDKWYSFIYNHGLWLCLATLACGIALWRLKRFDRRLVPSFLFLMLGLSYFATYFLTLPGANWLYLVPSEVMWLLSLLMSISWSGYRSALPAQAKPLEADPTNTASELELPPVVPG